MYLTCICVCLTLFEGADSGIQLLLNIEQYEYVKIRSVDAGVKVGVCFLDNMHSFVQSHIVCFISTHSLIASRIVNVQVHH